MKSTLSLAAVLLVTMAVTSTAFANSSSEFANPSQINLSNIFYLGNTGGTIVYNPVNQTLSMTSTITEIRSGGMDYTGNFGTITFTSGAMISGNIFTSATFSNGTYSITTNGTDGLPNGVLYSGTLYNVYWHEIGHTNQYVFNAKGAGDIHDTGTVISGTTQFNVVQGATVIPEPGTWALLGTGVLFLLGVAGQAGFKRRPGRFEP